MPSHAGLLFQAAPSRLLAMRSESAASLMSLSDHNYQFQAMSGARRKKARLPQWEPGLRMGQCAEG